MFTQSKTTIQKSCPQRADIEQNKKWNSDKNMELAKNFICSNWEVDIEQILDFVVKLVKVSESEWEFHDNNPNKLCLSMLLTKQSVKFQKNNNKTTTGSLEYHRESIWRAAGSRIFKMDRQVNGPERMRAEKYKMKQCSLADKKREQRQTKIRRPRGSNVKRRLVCERAFKRNWLRQTECERQRACAAQLSPITPLNACFSGQISHWNRQVRRQQ